MRKRKAPCTVNTATAMSMEALKGAEEAGADVPIVLDSGILTGEDIVAALALGADFTLIGRAYLYGLMAGGQEGVRRVIELLAKEVEVAMSLMGAATTADLTPASVRAPWLEG